MAAMPAVAQIEFAGNSKPVYHEVPATSTGLQHLYVLYSAQGVSMSYTASNDPGNVTWYDFGPEGGGSAIDPMTGINYNGNVSTLPQVIADHGYIIKEGDRSTCIWVVDYSKCRLHLESATVDPESDCGTTVIQINGSGNDIVYYTINGGRRVLDREIKITYNTLEWSADELSWLETSVTETEETFSTSMAVPASLCATTYTIRGDKLLEYWKETKQVTTERYSPKAVAAEVVVNQEERDNDNEQRSEGTAYGGSAPVNITFTAYCTDAVTYKEWQVSDFPEFNNILMTFPQDQVDYTFTDAGTTYWRFYYANSDGSCENYSDPIAVSIGESSLDCPNFFSPGTTEEVNDIWKVSYKSIVEFHCWIYNRWGNLIKEFTDPADGWDGKYNGKLVNAGVYFYVIRAKGSDGKEYKLSGDINILRYKKRELQNAIDDGM